MKSRTNRFEIIDFLKGYSIITIVIFHFCNFLRLPAPYDKLFFFGGTGVHLFILLSGFGLYYSYLRNPIPYHTFLKRRMSKVYVPYIVVVLISALISIMVPVYNNSPYALFGHIFLYKMFDESIMTSYGFQLWFVSMILQFYFAFYAIIWLKSKLTPNLFLITTLAVSIGWSLLVLVLGKETERIWNSFFLQYLWEFAFGMFVAQKVFRKEELPGSNAKQIILLSVGIICVFLYGILALKGGSIGKLFNDVFALLGYSCLAIFIYKLKLESFNKFLSFIGEISLAVYLVHILLLLTLAKLIVLNPIYIVALSIVILLPISFFYQKLINRFFKVIRL